MFVSKPEYQNLGVRILFLGAQIAGPVRESTVSESADLFLARESFAARIRLQLLKM